MVEGGVVEGDFVVGTSATGSGGGSPADTGPSLRGGIEIDGESWRLRLWRQREHRCRICRGAHQGLGKRRHDTGSQPVKR